MYCDGELISDFKQGWIEFQSSFKQGGKGFAVYKDNVPFKIYRYSEFNPNVH
jgi:hypothetical protein